MGRTDRTLLWGTAALIAFTLGAVAVARTDGGPVEATDDSRLCYNSAGVGAACLPPPADPDPPISAPSPFVSGPGGSGSAPAPTSAAPTRPASKPPASKKATSPAWAVGVAYRTGAQVTYRGAGYACLQTHTSQVDWSPVAAPALWSRVS
ncbi:carbohydrate-binding protein [Dactylosporangium cerinum]|uniref:Carbohydrate-binding protein n=1 Tax=Dactylosporangium cerinum TaxID=1434730 RepID=A0ABV9VKZ9_9ACTN